jgi:predicted NAD-dependent protein-ADP-ribosyltransferase YbiA (DUF1768 family)
MTIYFYVEREKPYGCFSNFSAHGLMLDELYWATECSQSVSVGKTLLPGTEVC